MIAILSFTQSSYCQIGKNPAELDSSSIEGMSDSERSKKEARNKIESYRQRVLKGESMSALAKLYSDDPGSAKEGGCYRDIGRGVFVPEFEEVAFKLKPGEISEVFETQYGFHFIQLIERKGDVVDLRHMLVKIK